MASNNALQQLLDILDGSYSSEENAIKLVALKRDCERLIAQEILKTGEDIGVALCHFSKLQFPHNQESSSTNYYPVR